MFGKHAAHVRHCLAGLRVSPASPGVSVTALVFSFLCTFLGLRAEPSSQTAAEPGLQQPEVQWRVGDKPNSEGSR